MDIKGKNIIVTGGLGSLGASVADALTAKGANVIILDRIENSADNYYKVNLTDSDEVETVLQSIDSIDILINCAGEIYSEPVVNAMKGSVHSIESWNRIIDNNLNSTFIIGSRVAYKMVKSRTKGLIINFSSISADGNMGQAAYSAAKAGIEALTKVFSKELGMFKIRTCAIAPGFIETPSTQNSLSESMLEHWKKATPLRRLGTTDDIIKTIFYIIETDYLSGAVINIDGGLSI